MCDKDFIKACLMQIIGEDAVDEIINYIVTIDNEDDYNEFMDNIVDKKNPHHATAYEALKVNLLGVEKKAPEKVGITAPKTKTQTKSQATTSTNNKNNQKNAKNNKPAENKQKKHQQQQKQQNKNDNVVTKKPPQNTNATTSKVEETKQSNRPLVKINKKLKFINFYDRDLKPGLLKGRHPCNCEARHHALVNNCTKCGRIVCEQEGSGPCFFCDNMVCTNDEMELLATNSKESDKLYNYFMERSRSKEWKKAIEARDRLLLNDSSGSKKNVIYDDESDYFKLDNSGNVLEAKDDKKTAKPKTDFYTKNRLPRSEMKLSLNLATRSVDLGKKDDIKNKEKVLNDVCKLMEAHVKRFPQYFSANHTIKDDANELLKDLAYYEKDTNKEEEKQTQNKQNTFTVVDGFKAASEKLLDIVDNGMCLSMHQPYASLLVAGIKKHEGRTWNTNHRGRLWIAAASKMPTDEEIIECENMYKNYYCDPSMKFPKTYPTSCLLGCVHVDDCLPQDEYRQKYPNGESASPFVLICRNPAILPLFYPISGQHKIFPLPKDLHRRVKTALLSATWLQ